MKKLIIFTGLFFILLNSGISQGCLPYGITFSTQTEIDDFQINYPNCTKIEGNLTIKGDSIDNLIGLNNITSIGGWVWIYRNPSLTSLAGLENIDSIGDYLRLRVNHALSNLSGLENLVSIGDYLYVSNNASLSSLSGLENLTNIDGNLDIINNDALISLEGLESISPNSITGIYIYNNDTLSTCNVQSICDYLVSPNGTVNIYRNAPGCNNPGEVATSCGNTLDCLPYGNYYFVSQDEVDNFESNYPNCTELNGEVIIESYDITNLIGLNSITSIEDDLTIGRPLVSGYNPLLTDLSGLENLSIINGTLNITNNSALLSLTGLSNLDSIGNSLKIVNNNSLLGLTGLSNLISVGESIRIYSNDDLNSLAGLENIISISGSLDIDNNHELTDLTGFENLELVSGDLTIWENDNLSDLFGLHNLLKIGEGLTIRSTESLVDFSGLDNLDSIGGSITVEFNQGLTDFTGLGNLSSIEGNVTIMYNNNLTSLTGLDNINPGSINRLTIVQNNDLSYCSVLSICDYLANPTDVVSIYDNATGCDSPPEIADECGFTLPCLPFGNYYLGSQADVDDFFIDYPGCFDLKGGLEISGENITDLSGLDGLNSIEGGLGIYSNDSLINFTGLSSLTTIGGGLGVGYYGGKGNPMLQNFVGLDGLTTIGGSFEIMYNDSLTDFSGLNGLQSVGGYLTILSNYNLSRLSGLENLDSINGALSISGTNFLNDITHLSNLTFVDGSIGISNNEILNSLSGLDNIEPSSIDFLVISNNSELATCAVASICEYLADSNSSVNINNNAPGCNNQEEVEFACTLNVPETNIQHDVKFYPNPSTNEIFISTKIATAITELSLYNCLGQKVLHKKGKTDKIDISTLKRGIYILELVTDNSKFREKLIIQ